MGSEGLNQRFTMTDIFYEKVERDCDYNRGVKEGRYGNTHLLYDWKIKIDGEHRAWFLKNAARKGYRLCRIDDGSLINQNAGAVIQRDFEAVVLRVIHEIPTIAGYAQAAEDAVRLEEFAEQNRREQEYKVRLRESAEDMLKLLKEIRQELSRSDCRVYAFEARIDALVGLIGSAS